MRAATLAHPSVVSAATARAAMGKLALAVLATFALLLVWRPTVVHAQSAPAHGAPSTDAAAHVAPAQTDSGSAAHVVKAGESLWGLAERYYGDGHQWQELARRNALTPAKGKILLVGMKLKVPAKAPAARVAKATAAKSAKSDDSVPAYVRAAAVAPTSPTASSAPAATPAAAPAPATTAPAGSTLSAQTADKGDAAPAPSSARAPRAANNKVAYGAARREAVASAPAPKAAVIAVAPTPAAKSDSPSSDASTRDAAQDSGRTFGTRVSRQSETLMTRKATRIGLVDRDDLDAARSPKEAATVFLRHVPEAAEVDAQARALSYADKPAPRRGEYEAAPFSLEQSAIAKGGRVRHRVGAPTGALIESQQRVTLADEVEITAPAGLTLAAGDRLVVLSEIAPASKKKGPVVVVPTGILQILPTAPGKPLHALVQKQTGNIEQGQLLLPVEGSAMAPSVKAAASATSDVETTVRWLDTSESLPTLQSYLLLGAGRAQGVQAGDEFELHTPRGAGNTGDERIARVRIVRVGQTESTGIVVRQERSDIVVGVAARRVARVP